MAARITGFGGDVFGDRNGCGDCRFIHGDVAGTAQRLDIAAAGGSINCVATSGRETFCEDVIPLLSANHQRPGKGPDEPKTHHGGP